MKFNSQYFLQQLEAPSMEEEELVFHKQTNKKKKKGILFFPLHQGIKTKSLTILIVVYIKDVTSNINKTANLKLCIKNWGQTTTNIIPTKRYKEY